MDIWLERFVLALLAAAFLSLVVLNLMKLDMTQRVTLAIAIAAFSYFVAYTVSVTRSGARQSVGQVRGTQSTEAGTSQKSVSSVPSATLPSTNVRPTIKVTDNHQKPVSGVDVLLLNADGTHLKMMTTDENGLVEVSEEVAGPVTMFCAHPHFHHYRRAKFDLHQSLSIQMSASSDGGSLLIADGTGYIPGLDGRLNPILDDQGRTYLYAQNIALEGGKAQPMLFTVGRPFDVKDSYGHAFRLEIISIVGSSSLIEYSRMPDPVSSPVDRSKESSVQTVVCIDCGEHPGKNRWCIGTKEHQFKQFGPPANGIFCRLCGDHPDNHRWCLGTTVHQFMQFGRPAHEVYCRLCGDHPGNNRWCLGTKAHDFLPA